MKDEKGVADDHHGFVTSKPPVVRLAAEDVLQAEAAVVVDASVVRRTHGIPAVHRAILADEPIRDSVEAGVDGAEVVGLDLRDAVLPQKAARLGRSCPDPGNDRKR